MSLHSSKTKMIIYDPGFMIYPAIYMFGVILCYAFSKRGPGLFFLLLAFWSLFWIILFVFLSYAKGQGWLPCLKLLGNNLGGCL